MNIYVSTNMFKVNQLEEVFNILENISYENVGIELFTEFHDDEFMYVVNRNMNKLKKYKVSIHGPYYNTEHSAEKGSDKYNKSKEYFINALELSKELNSPYIVFHHNNCRINDKEVMINNSKENLDELKELAKGYNANVVIENAGIISSNNMLFNQEEFIQICKENDCGVLIDIGHAFANGWDLEYVIKELKNKIISYHLHNNDGKKDSHDSICYGSFNIDEFLEMYNKYTNEADLVLEYNKEYRNKINILIEDIDYIKSRIK